MNRLPRGLTQKPKDARDPLEVMLLAEATQKEAEANMRVWQSTGDPAAYQHAMIEFAKATTLWAKAQFYGMPL